MFAVGFVVWKWDGKKWLRPVAHAVVQSGAEASVFLSEPGSGFSFSCILIANKKAYSRGFCSTVPRKTTKILVAFDFLCN